MQVSEEGLEPPEVIITTPAWPLNNPNCAALLRQASQTGRQARFTFLGRVRLIEAFSKSGMHFKLKGE
jgi:hypothetical protein